MPIIEQRCRIECAQEVAFEVSQNHQLRKLWDPFPEKHEDYGEGVSAGEGAVFTITGWHRMRMQVEYVSWRRPERAAIRMVQGPKFLKLFAGSWSFQPVSDSMVEARFRYQLRAHTAWRWLEPAMRAYFSWETRRRLAALKRYLESLANNRNHWPA